MARSLSYSTRLRAPRPGTGRRALVTGAMVATTIAFAGSEAIAGTTSLHSAATTTYARVTDRAAIPFHLALSRAEPSANDTVAVSPTAIKLWFTESIQPAVTSIRVVGPAKHLVLLGAVTVDKAAKSPAVFPVQEALKPGTYNVTWKTMATDGHPTTGKFAFVVRAIGAKAATKAADKAEAKAALKTEVPPAKKKAGKKGGSSVTPEPGA